MNGTTDTAESQGEQDTAMFVHDTIVSYQSIYPLDLKPGTAIAETIEQFKGSAKFADLKDIMCNSPSSTNVFVNLFWLFFCLKFQRNAYLALKVTNCYQNGIARIQT